MKVAGSWAPVVPLRPELSPAEKPAHGFQNPEVHSALSYKPGTQVLWRSLSFTIRKMGAMICPGGSPRS